MPWEIAQFESFKKSRPPRIDRIRIFLPTAIVVFNQVKIRPSVD
jgi:hypothetical protein